MTILHVAIKERDKELFNKVLKSASFTQLNQLDSGANRWTPLELAAACGEYEMVCALLVTAQKRQIVLEKMFSAFNKAFACDYSAIAHLIYFFGDFDSERNTLTEVKSEEKRSSYVAVEINKTKENANTQNEHEILEWNPRDLRLALYVALTNDCDNCALKIVKKIQAYDHVAEKTQLLITSLTGAYQYAVLNMASEGGEVNQKKAEIAMLLNACGVPANNPSLIWNGDDILRFSSARLARSHNRNKYPQLPIHHRGLQHDFLALRALQQHDFLAIARLSTGLQWTEKSQQEEEEKNATFNLQTSNSAHANAAFAIFPKIGFLATLEIQPDNFSWCLQLGLDVYGYINNVINNQRLLEKFVAEGYSLKAHIHHTIISGDRHIISRLHKACKGEKGLLLTDKLFDQMLAIAVADASEAAMIYLADNYNQVDREKILTGITSEVILNRFKALQYDNNNEKHEKKYEEKRSIKIDLLSKLSRDVLWKTTTFLTQRDIYNSLSSISNYFAQQARINRLANVPSPAQRFDYANQANEIVLMLKSLNDYRYISFCQYFCVYECGEFWGPIPDEKGCIPRIAAPVLLSLFVGMVLSVMVSTNIGTESGAGVFLLTTLVFYYMYKSALKDNELPRSSLWQFADNKPQLYKQMKELLAKLKINLADFPDMVKVCQRLTEELKTLIEQRAILQEKQQFLKQRQAAALLRANGGVITQDHSTAIKQVTDNRSSTSDEKHSRNYTQTTIRQIANNPNSNNDGDIQQPLLANPRYASLNL